MFAKSNIKCGDILIKEQPFIYVLSSKFRTEHCDNCFAKGQLLKCSNCQYVYYCGKGCQREGWALHKPECNSLKNVAPRIVPDATRLMARIIRKLSKGGGAVRSYYAKDKFRTFKDLMSHYSDLKLDQHRLEHFTSICAVLFEFLNDTSLPNSAEIIGIYGRMCINSFSICDPELKSLGTGMYLAASIVDHSCEPNAVATFEGPTLFIRSLVDFNYLDWTKVFISYIDVLNTPKGRQEELETQYYFLCKCSRCLDDSNLHLVYGAACPNSNCNGCVDMRNEKNYEELECDECSTKPDACFVEKFREITEYSSETIQSMKNLTYLDACKACLKRQDGVLHKLNVHHVKILDLAFESSIDFGHWTEAKTFGLELTHSYPYYYNNLNPLLGLLYLKLAKILSLLEEQREAAKYLKKAFNVLKVTHGVKSVIFRNEVLPLMEQLTLELNNW